MINYLALQPMQCATVAQPVEQLTRNEQVVRSNRISSSTSNSPKVGFPSQFSGSFVSSRKLTFPRKSALITPKIQKESLQCKSRWTKINKPTAGRTKVIQRRLELSFNLYLLLLLWVKTELSKKPPTYNPGFSASCSFSTNKTFEGQLKPSKPFSYRRFSWLTLCGCQVRNKNFCKK